MSAAKSTLFDLTRKVLIAVTGNGSDRGRRMNDFHHKLSNRLHTQLPKFGIVGEVKIEIPGLGGRTLRMIAEDGGVAHQFLVYGKYEPYESALVDRVVKRGMTVYNVGANIGYYTIRASLRAANEGRVYAFEPSKANFGLLSRNVEENGLENVRLINAAVSDVAGPLQLFISQSNSGDHQIFPAGETRASQEIEGIALGEFLTEEPAPDVIIMDVQGSEYRVLKGMETYLTSQDRKPLTLFTEFAPTHLKRAGSSAEALLGLIARAGLRIYLIDERRKRVEEISNEELLRTTQGHVERNLLCCESSRIAQVLSLE